MKKKISITILILTVIVSLCIYNYIYKDHRNVENETAAFVLSSNQLFEVFKNDVIMAENKYLNKTIEITGVASSKENNSITLNKKVFCQFSKQLGNINTETNLRIKGRVIGYDDLLEQIKLDQCSIIN